MTARGAGLLRAGELTSDSEGARFPGTAGGGGEEEEGALKTDQHSGASQVAAGFRLCACYFPAAAERREREGGGECQLHLPQTPTSRCAGSVTENNGVGWGVGS